MPIVMRTPAELKGSVLREAALLLGPLHLPSAARLVHRGVAHLRVLRRRPVRRRGAHGILARLYAEALWVHEVGALIVWSLRPGEWPLAGWRAPSDLPLVGPSHVWWHFPVGDVAKSGVTVHRRLGPRRSRPSPVSISGEARRSWSRVVTPRSTAVVITRRSISDQSVQIPGRASLFSPSLPHLHSMK